MPTDVAIAVENVVELEISIPKVVSSSLSVVATFNSTAIATPIKMLESIIYRIGPPISFSYKRI